MYLLTEAASGRVSEAGSEGDFTRSRPSEGVVSTAGAHVT